MTPLPVPLTDPLHILSPLGPWVWLAAALALVLAMLARRLGRRRASPSPPAEAQAAVVPSTIETRIAELVERFGRTEAYREGCHALATLVRTFLERQTGLEIEEMTSAEIAGAIEDPRIGEFMKELRTHQYRRREPKRSHFIRLCERAIELLRPLPRRGRRPEGATT